MDKEKIIEELEGIENRMGVKLPGAYKRFLSEEVQGSDSFEMESIKGGYIYIYNYKDIIERNETYAVREFEPDYILIGQDGDLGYFISSKDNDDKIYSLDLGALGSLNMDEEASDIYKLRA